MKDAVLKQAEQHDVEEADIVRWAVRDYLLSRGLALSSDALEKIGKARGRAAKTLAARVKPPIGSPKSGKP